MAGGLDVTERAGGDGRYRVVGKAMGRADGPEKVTGRANYSIDATLPGMLWVKVLRSPYPHARILRVDTSRAEGLPGVHAILTGADVRGMRVGKRLRDEPLLAWDRVLFIGDKVAAVAAEDEDIAQQALDLLEVEYEELPYVTEPEEALSPTAPILHPEINSYQGLPKPFEAVSNLYGHDQIERGDVAAGFSQADLIVERSYRTPRTHQAYLEPHSCLVWIDPQGRIQVWLGSKSPLANRSQLAGFFDLPPEQFEMNFTFVGGDFGGKGDTIGVPLCYLLAKKTGRPVKMVLDYSEDLATTNPRHAAHMRIKAGVKRDGTLTAWQAEFHFSNGAYASTKYAPGLSIAEIAGPYRIPNVRIDSHMVYTNTVPGGYHRAPGEAQGIFAGESHMDVIARELGMDPVELRLKNVIHDGDPLPNGHQYQAVQAEAVLRAAVEASDYHGVKPAHVGRGVALGHRSQPGGATNVGVSVRGDGSVIAHTSVHEAGSGTYTLLKQMVAEEMGIAPERVRVVPSVGDIVSPNDMGPVGARISNVASQGVYQASTAVKQRLRRLAAELLGWDEARVAYREGRLVDEGTGRSVAMEQIAARLGEPVEGQADVNETEPNPYTSFVAQVAEVSVDPETGKVKLLRLTSAHDTGQVLNPIGFQAQIDGGIVTGLGFGLMEELVVEDGRITNPSFADFKIPTVRDIPELRTVLVQTPAGVGPYKIKGIGEHANITTSPAIANAVADACGVRVTDLPVAAEKVWKELEHSSSGDNRSSRELSP